MKDKILNTKISLFTPPISNTTKDSDVNILHVFDLIKGDAYKQITEALRTIKDSGKNREYKRIRFTNVTFSGTFQKRDNNSIIQHSDFIAIDIDKLSDAVTVRGKIENDPRCKKSLLLSFLSPNGNGLKAVFLIDSKSHEQKEFYIAISRYITQLCGLEKGEVDKSCSDIVRTCYLPYDPDVYIHPALVSESTQIIKPFDISELLSNDQDDEDIEADYQKLDNETVEREKQRLTKLVRKEINDAKDGNKHNVLRKMAFMLGGFVASGVLDEEYAKNLLREEIKKKENVESLEDAYKTIERGLEKGKEKPLLPAKKKSQKVSLYKEEKSELRQILDYLKEEGIKFNEITFYADCNGKVVSEQAMNSLYLDAKESGIKISRPLFDMVINSNHVEKYNPVIDFIKANSNTIPQGHIERLARCLNTVQDYDFVYLFLRKWLIGMVASVFGRNHNVLFFVLIGPVNTGKTEFFRRLLPEELMDYLAQSKLDQGKDSEALMCIKLLILNDELDGLSRKKAREFRNFISAPDYTFRRPYARFNTTEIRLASVCGTSNDKNIIQQPEHNRRIVPVEIFNMDFDLYNSINKTELFMEAYFSYKSGEKWELSSQDVELLQSSTIEYEITNDTENLIGKYFTIPDEDREDAEWMNPTDIKVFLESKSGIKLYSENIGKALTRLGFEKKVRKIPKTRKNEQVYRVLKVELSDNVNGEREFGEEDPKRKKGEAEEGDFSLDLET